MTKMSKEKTIHLAKQENNNCSSYLSWNNTKYDEQVFRLIYCGLWYIDMLKYNNDLDDKVSISLSKKELEELGFKTRTNRVAELKAIGDEAQSVRIRLEQNNDYVSMILFPTIRYSNGVFNLTINRDVVDNYKYLENNFTQLQYETIKLLSFGESQLYLYLKSYLDNSKQKYSWKVKVNIDDLKKLMKCENKYNDWNNFYKRRIIPSIRAINNLTDIHIFSFKKIRGEDRFEIKFEWNKQNRIKYIPPNSTQENEEQLSKEEFDEIKKLVEDLQQN